VHADAVKRPKRGPRASASQGLVWQTPVSYRKEEKMGLRNAKKHTISDHEPLDEGTAQKTRLEPGAHTLGLGAREGLKPASQERGGGATRGATRKKNSKLTDKTQRTAAPWKRKIEMVTLNSIKIKTRILGGAPWGVIQKKKTAG